MERVSTVDQEMDAGLSVREEHEGLLFHLQALGREIHYVRIRMPVHCHHIKMEKTLGGEGRLSFPKLLLLLTTVNSSGLHRYMSEIGKWGKVHKKMGFAGAYGDESSRTK